MKTLWEGISSLITAGLGAIPLWGVRLLVIGMMTGLAIWALRLPADYAFKGAPSRSPFRDVRLWAAVVIILEIIPYIIF